MIFRRKKLIGFLALLFGLVIIFSIDIYSPPDELKVTFLDVGFGEAIAVQTPAGSNLLINAGARKWDHHYHENKGKRYDYGEKIIAPFWLSQGIKRLDLLALQSVEPQRSGGLAYLTEHLNIDRAVGPLPLGVGRTERRFIAAIGGDLYQRTKRMEHFSEDYYGNWKRWIKQIRENNISYENPARNDVIYSEQSPSPYGPVEFKIRVLNPPEQSDYAENPIGNQSLVFKLEYRDVSFLLPGDIKQKAQEEMVNTIPELVESDVLVVPSNGVGDSSYNPDFIDAVNPRYVVLSSSKQIEIKPHWFASSLINNLKNYQNKIPGSKLFYTGRDKAVIFTSDGIGLKVKTFAN